MPVLRISPVLMALSMLSLVPMALSQEPAADRDKRSDRDGTIPCVDGFADIYPCKDVDLIAHVTLGEMGGGSGNDLWGWTDPLTGIEYALMGRTTGTSFIELDDPEHPRILGDLPTTPGASNTTWRDIKVYADHAFIVSDLGGAHGMQVFDLTQLRNVTNPPVTFSPTALYTEFDEAHNIVIDTQSGFAFAVGSTDGDITCAGGLHMIDIRDPANPTFAGCFSADGYTHDAQCVTYQGPDPDHQGEEICFCCNADTLTVVDVTDKANPVQLARKGYANSGYTHQGWLTDDHTYFLLDDETDELNQGHGTRTYIWNVSDLDDPQLIGSYTAQVASSDHNQYVHRNFTYQANYSSGMRILNLDNVAAASLTEAAFFDTRPSDDNRGFGGAWSTYPFFDSGIVLVSDRQRGLFVLFPRICSAPAVPTGLSLVNAGPATVDLSWTPAVDAASYHVYRSFGGCPASAPVQIAANVLTTTWRDTTVSGQVPYAYYIASVDDSGECQSSPSECQTITPTGPCTSPPQFAGLERIEDLAGGHCALRLIWSPAVAWCGGPASYDVFRSLLPDFQPGPENLLRGGLTANEYTDTMITPGNTWYYLVRARDEQIQLSDGNRVIRSGSPTGQLVDGTWTAGAEIGDPAFGGGAGEGRHVGWELVGDRAHSGERSYFSTYETSFCVGVTTPAIQLAAGQAAELSFWTLYDIENGQDGGEVMVTSDGGDTWQKLGMQEGYPAIYNSSDNACGAVPGASCFSGTNLTWTRFTADLSAFAGKEVHIAWSFSTDGLLNLEGWYVDDIAVAHALVPGTCQGCFLPPLALEWPARSVAAIVSELEACLQTGR